MTWWIFMMWLYILVTFYGFSHFLKSTQIGSKALCSLWLFMHDFVVCGGVRLQKCFFSALSLILDALQFVVFHFYVPPISNLPPFFFCAFYWDFDLDIHHAHSSLFTLDLFPFLVFTSFFIVLVIYFPIHSPISCSPVSTIRLILYFSYSWSYPWNTPWLELPSFLPLCPLFFFYAFVFLLVRVIVS